MSLTKAEQFSKRIQGPVFPILTLFGSDGQIDEQGIADYVEYLISQGAKNLMCTVGTSRYDVLTTDEMLRMNQIVVESVANRAVTMVTTPSYGSTSQAIKFAQHAERIGADAIIAVYPDRYYGDDSIFEFFHDIASACGIGVMIHEMPIRAGRSTEAPSAQYSAALLERIFSLPGMVGLKEESGNAELIQHINSEYSSKLAVIGGRGGMGGYRQAAQYGQQAYLVGIGNFLPSLEFDFFKQVKNGNDVEADEILKTKEQPFFELAVRLGWHITLKEAMYIKGLCQPYERAPLPRLNADERQQLNELMQKLGF